ncbi:hypothetical protein Daus18300_009272 [Diaporthe australafricana]|uniref:Uncharacterized protein n=1 Tax=Diaporthe australafricana TaxID=127596 RepID=A0ABR3WF32_9PEZI
MGMYDRLQDPGHNAGVASAMRNAGSARAFRQTLRSNADLRELVMQPLASEIQIWTAYIWQFLIQRIFSAQGMGDFYSSNDENAAYYIRNIDEIDYLMKTGDTALADEFARRTWKKQALDAVFPVDNNADPIPRPGASLFPRDDHPWLASTRAAAIEALASQLLRIFDVFSRPMNNGLDLTRTLITHAVRLNECMLHGAEVIYTVDLGTGSDDDFYQNLDNMTMSTVNTDLGRTVPLRRVTRGQTQDYVRSRLYKVCVVEPALRYQSYQSSDLNDPQYGPAVTVINSTVTVGWGLNRNNPPTISPPRKNNMFYIMAQSLGYA